MRKPSKRRQLDAALGSILANGPGSNLPLVFVAGDFNGANIVPLLNAAGLTQINEQATRGKRCLDLILTNAPPCYSSEIWPELGASDHKTIVALAPNTRYRTMLPRAECRLVRSGRLEDTVASIRAVNWNQVIAKLKVSPQEATDDFYHIIKMAEELNQPLVKLKLRGDKPWMNSEIKKLICQRQRLLKHGKTEQWKKVAQVIKRRIEKRKKIHYRLKYTVGKPDYWKEVRALSGPPLKGAFDAETAESLNSAFHGVWGGNRQPDLSKFRSSPGPDELSTVLLKSSRLELVEILTTMFNEFVNQGFVPTQWKGANITPIPKVKHPKSLFDYRPI